MKGKKFKKQWSLDFVNILQRLKNEDLAIGFLNVLFTAKERKEFALRLQILKMLERGYTHREVADELGVGISTVSRGARELQFRKTSFLDLL